MYRVILPASAAVLLAACSVGSASKPVTMGYSDTAPTAKSSKQSTSSLGGDPAASRSANGRQKTAALQDLAPKGTYDKAPPGALADRDYTATSLNAEMARDAINAYRKANGLKPLKLDANLSTAAKAHSRDLARWDRISHYGSDGSNPWDRVKRSGYNARLAAENVGTGQVDFGEVLKGWKNSPGHNKNLLLGEAEHMGIALVNDPKTEFKTFWTLVLGTPM